MKGRYSLHFDKKYRNSDPLYQNTIVRKLKLSHHFSINIIEKVFGVFYMPTISI